MIEKYGKALATSFDVGEMPEWQQPYFTPEYRAAYPWIKAYGENLWWESIIPYAFAPAYGASAWGALERRAHYYPSMTSEYLAQETRYSIYAAAGRPWAEQAMLLAGARGAYYSQREQMGFFSFAYSATKLLSYFAPFSLGLYRGFAFAPWSALTTAGAANVEAPFISEMVNRFGPNYVMNLLESDRYGTLFPFTQPGAQELWESGVEWTLGQSSLLLIPGAIRGVLGAGRGGLGLLAAGDLTGLGNVTSNMLRAAQVRQATNIGWNYLRTDISQLGLDVFKTPLSADEILAFGNAARPTSLGRAAWAGMGGWGGIMSGAGFGLMQFGVSMSLEELSYVYAMGKAGINPYAKTAQQQQGLINWSMGVGGVAAGGALWGAGAAYTAQTGFLATLESAGIETAGMMTPWAAAWSGALTSVAPALIGVYGSIALGFSALTYRQAQIESRMPTYGFNIAGIGRVDIWGKEPLVYGKDILGTRDVMMNPRLVGPRVAPTEFQRNLQLTGAEMAWGLGYPTENRYIVAAQQEQWNRQSNLGLLPSDIRESRVWPNWAYAQMRGIAQIPTALQYGQPQYGQAPTAAYDWLIPTNPQTRYGFVPQTPLGQMGPGAIPTWNPYIPVGQITGPYNPYGGYWSTIGNVTGQTYNIGGIDFPGWMFYAPGNQLQVAGYVPKPLGWTWNQHGNTWDWQIPTGQQYYFGGIKTKAEAESYQLWLSGASSLWLAQNTFRITGYEGDYGVKLIRGVGTLGSESLANYARSQVWGTNKPGDIALAQTWLDRQFKTGIIDEVTYEHAMINLQSQAAYTARVGYASIPAAGMGYTAYVYDPATNTFGPSTVGWTFGTDASSKSTFWAMVGAGLTDTGITQAYMEHGYSEELTAYLVGKEGAPYRTGAGRPSGMARRLQKMIALQKEFGEDWEAHWPYQQKKPPFVRMMGIGQPVTMPWGEVVTPPIPPHDAPLYLGTYALRKAVWWTQQWILDYMTKYYLEHPLETPPNGWIPPVDDDTDAAYQARKVEIVQTWLPRYKGQIPDWIVEMARETGIPLTQDQLYRNELWEKYQGEYPEEYFVETEQHYRELRSGIYAHLPELQGMIEDVFSTMLEPGVMRMVDQGLGDKISEFQYRRYGES